MAPKTNFAYLGVDEDRKPYLVIDAATPIEFKVLRRHYRKSFCGNSEKCALSTALRETDKSIRLVFTGLTTAYIIYAKNPNVAVRYAVPVSLRDAIEAFDRTGFLAPGIYHFNVLPKSRQIGSRVGSTGSNVRRGIVKNVRTKRPMADRTVPTRRANSKTQTA